MAKLLSITCTKEEGCHSEYASDREWVVTTPQGVLIPLKMYTGLTKGMPYIDIRSWKEVFGMIQTVKNNFDNFTSEDIYKANISRKTQSMVANLTDDKFKEIVSGSNLNNFLVEVIYVSNSSASYDWNQKWYII